MKTGINRFGWVFVACLAVLVVGAFSGCVHTEVDLPNSGGHFSRTSFLSNQSVGKIDVRTSGSQNPGVSIDSYGNNSTEVAAAALALANALAKKP
jgi:hypothetical protein